MNFDFARKIADAVLYEGYVLYPYRRSSAKNKFRWQFGIVAPRAWSDQGGESWEMQTECLIEPLGSAQIDATVRFLQVRVDTKREEWEESVERTLEHHAIRLEDLMGAGRDLPFEIPAEASGAIAGSIRGQLRLSAEQVTGCEKKGLVKLRVRIENLTELPDDSDRPAAMRRSLIGTHTLLGVQNGAFVSLLDPPAPARAAATACANIRTWPVLACPKDARDVMLSSPIILEDYPVIAPESQMDFFDATEIDEMLTLRVMTLTDEEKTEARATDERTRSIIERCDSMPPEMLGRLHGVMRPLDADLRPLATGSAGTRRSAEEFFNPPDEQPEQAVVRIARGSVSKGDRVRLSPKRNADTMDFFLAGRTALVEGIHRDVENQAYVAVSVEDDPAADIQGRSGRFFYFYPDELEPV